MAGLAVEGEGRKYQPPSVSVHDTPTLLQERGCASATPSEMSPSLLPVLLHLIASRQWHRLQRDCY